MEWFLNTFLPNIELRMNNPKYPNQTIITRNQFDICCKYFHSVQCHGDYGWFTVWEFATNDASYQITFRGKYIFLTKTPREEDPIHKAKREKERLRIKLEAVERTKRRPERLAKRISALQRKLQGLKETYEMDLVDGDEDDIEFDLHAIEEAEKELALYMN